MTTRYLQVWSQKIFFKKKRVQVFEASSVCSSFSCQFLGREVVYPGCFVFFGMQIFFLKQKKMSFKNHQRKQKNIHVHFHHLIPHLQRPTKLAFLETLGLPAVDTWIDRMNLLGKCRGFSGGGRGDLIRGVGADGFCEKSPIFEQTKERLPSWLFKVYIGDQILPS